MRRYGAYQLLRMETPVSNPWPGGDEGYAANPKIAVKSDNTRDGSDHTGMQYGASVMGCVKLSDFLKLQGVSVSSSTVRKILIRNGMGSVYDRWLKVEERRLESGLELTAEQAAVKVQPLLQGTAYGILSSRGTPIHDVCG